MSRVAFTKAYLKRAVEAAREVDPRAIVEVTRDGVVRILPAQAARPASAVDEWFAQDDQG